jgi:hypothetical protein
MALYHSADSRSAKLQASFQNLAAAASTLNSASEAFGDAMRTLDDAINKLNPGVTAWVTVSHSTDERGLASEERLGYAKTNGKWGLTICSVTINPTDGSEETDDSWLFSDAPRTLRLAAIDHVPELMESLARKAAHTATRVNEAAGVAKQLAMAVSAVPSEKERR